MNIVLNDDESIIKHFSISRKIYALLLVRLIVLSFVIFAVLMVIAMAIDSSNFLAPITIITILTFITTLYTFLVTFIKCKYTNYFITNKKIVSCSGFLNRQQTFINLEDIKAVNSKRYLADIIFKISLLEIASSATSLEASIRLEKIDNYKNIQKEINDLKVKN